MTVEAKEEASPWALFQKYIMEWILLALCVFFAVYDENFLSPDNLLNVLRTVSIKGVIAFGMTMVIIAGEIDLSVGSHVAMAGCLMAALVQAGLPIPLAILLVLAIGAAVGSFVGVIRTSFGVPSFIVSLALFTALKGFAFMVTGGFSIMPFPAWFNVLGGGNVMGIPVPALLFLAVFGIVHFLMNHTAFGRSVYAVGGNAEAARLCGIRVTAVRIAVLGITGMLAGLSGILLSSRLMSGNPGVALQWELDVISAVIIGGTSFTGGVGTVWGTLIGVIFIGVIVNGMTLMNVDPYAQYVVRGALILLAVLINQVQRSDGH